MCYFISVGTLGSYSADIERSIPRGLALHPVENKSISEALPAGYRTYLITSGGSSCSLYSRKAAPLDRTNHFERFRRKHEKLGWSKAKIDRAIMQATLNPKLRPGQDFTGLRQDVVQLLTGFVHSCDDVAVLVHFYNGDLQTERFNIRKRFQISVTQFAGEEYALEENDLLWVRKKSVVIN